jgi:hypothetical protein
VIRCCARFASSLLPFVVLPFHAPVRFKQRASHALPIEFRLPRIRSRPTARLRRTTEGRPHVPIGSRLLFLFREKGERGPGNSERELRLQVQPAAGPPVGSMWTLPAPLRSKSERASLCPRFAKIPRIEAIRLLALLEGLGYPCFGIAAEHRPHSPLKYEDALIKCTLECRSFGVRS